jgi:hypothetical protein
MSVIYSIVPACLVSNYFRQHVIVLLLVILQNKKCKFTFLDSTFIQDGSEVISIKRETAETQQEQEKSAVAITFTEIKAEEEVSCIYLYPLLFRFPNIFGYQNILLCVAHIIVHNTYI